MTEHATENPSTTAQAINRPPIALTTVGFDAISTRHYLVFFTAIVPIFVSYCMLLGAWFSKPSPVLSSTYALFFFNGIAVAAILLTYLLLRRRKRKNLRNVLEQGATKDLGMALFTGLRQLGTIHPSSCVADIVEALLQKRLLGNTLRLICRDKVQQVSPFDVRIDPTPLDASNPGFVELEGPPLPEAATADPAVVSLSPARTKPGSRLSKRLLRYQWLLLLIWLLMVGSNCVMRYVSTGRMDPVILTTLVLVAIMLTTTHWYYRFASGYDWLVVNGGLIHRTATRNRLGSKVRLYDRRTSILCLCELRDGTRLVRVADEQGVAQTLVTDPEERMLLRAWLSPLAPPAVEKLVDLT